MDFYDLWVMAQDFTFDGEELSKAIGNTFARRQTELPDGTPAGLGPGFAGDRQKNVQWRAFLSKVSVPDEGLALADVCERLAAFLRPPTAAARRKESFGARWSPGGPWL